MDAKLIDARAAHLTSATSPGAVIRSWLAASTQVAARVSLAALMVVLPIRYSWLIAARPMPPIYDGYTNLMLYPSDLALGALLISWIVNLIVRPRRITGGPRFLFWPLVGLTLLGLISITYSVDPVLSFY